MHHFNMAFVGKFLEILIGVPCPHQKLPMTPIRQKVCEDATAAEQTTTTTLMSPPPIKVVIDIVYGAMWF